MPASETKKKPPTAKPARAAKARLSLDDVMRALESAGSEQTRKTYARHGAVGPMFGVSFATLKTLMKRIGVDHELAVALWETGNLDARNLAVKIVDPPRLTSDDLDRWVRESWAAQLGGTYVAMLAAEGPHAASKAREWLASKEVAVRCAGWTLVGQLSQRHETMPDAYFAGCLAEIERSIHSAPNSERDVMNQTVITIGFRSQELREAALAAADRIGRVEIDRGDTACKTPDAAPYIEKAWAHATSKGFASPAAQERAREVPRRRC